jgi:hypothetical protein
VAETMGAMLAIMMSLAQKRAAMRRAIFVMINTAETVRNLTSQFATEFSRDYYVPRLLRSIAQIRCVTRLALLHQIDGHSGWLLHCFVCAG